MTTERVTIRQMEVLDLVQAGLVRGLLQYRGMKYFAGRGRDNNVTREVTALLKRGLVERRSFGGPYEAVVITRAFEVETR